MTAAVATATRLFHVGLADDCPIEEVTAGGIRLHKATAKVSIDMRGNTKRDRRPGQVMRLTDGQLAALAESVSRLAIRRRSAQVSTDGTETAPGDNGVEWRVIMVDGKGGKPKLDLVGHRVSSSPVKDEKGNTIAEEVVRTPQFERRALDAFDPRTDEALAPYVFVEQVDSDPFGAQPRTRLDAPEWAKPADAPTAEDGPAKPETPAEQPKRSARAARAPAE